MLNQPFRLGHFPYWKRHYQAGLVVRLQEDFQKQPPLGFGLVFPGFQMRTQRHLLLATAGSQQRDFWSGQWRFTILGFILGKAIRYIEIKYCSSTIRYSISYCTIRYHVQSKAITVHHHVWDQWRSNGITPWITLNILMYTGWGTQDSVQLPHKWLNYGLWQI